MKRILSICFLIGFSFVLLTSNPGATARAQACSGQCYACACAYGGDVSCTGNYTVPAPGCICPSGLPNGCITGSGGYFGEVINAQAMCHDDGQGGTCNVCPFPPNQWSVYYACPGW